MLLLCFQTAGGGAAAKRPKIEVEVDIEKEARAGWVNILSVIPCYLLLQECSTYTKYILTSKSIFYCLHKEI